MLALPTLFIEQLRPLLPDGELEDFMGALNTPPPVSVRFNPKKKLDLATFEQNLGLHSEPVAWHTEGVYLEERPVFTLDPSFHAGAYYVQEASSMFIAEALRQHVDFQEDIKILDLCAAPGGKSTLLAALMSDDSFLLANEVIKNRVDILKENIIKWGQTNTYVSNHDPEDFAPLADFFDIVLVDAPCSGEGMFRKDPQAAQEWSPEAVVTCSARQKRILAHAQNLVKSGGFLLYSTCTYNEFENEKNAEFILENTDFQPLTIDLNPEWRVTKLKYGYQFFPHKTKGEGFYLSFFQKNNKENSDGVKFNETKLNFTRLNKKQVEALENWVENAGRFEFFQKPNGQIFMVQKTHLPFVAALDKALRRKSTGIDIGEFKGNDFIPSHDLALSTAVSTQIPTAQLSKRGALIFLKKENLELPDAQKGWVLAQFGGLNLGWLKVLPTRVNNYLPKDFRIRMEIKEL